MDGSRIEFLLAGVAGSNPAGDIDVFVVSKDKKKRQNAEQSRQRKK